MTLFYIDGDISNDSIQNFDIHCAACNLVRHCGSAGLKRKLVLRCSKLSQLEIVHKTRAWVNEHGSIPSVTDLDPQATHTFNGMVPLSMVDFANRLAASNYSELPGYMREFKGFFTSTALEEFRD